MRCPSEILLVPLRGNRRERDSQEFLALMPTTWNITKSALPCNDVHKSCMCLLCAYNLHHCYVVLTMKVVEENQIKVHFRQSVMVLIIKNEFKQFADHQQGNGPDTSHVRHIHFW